MKRSVETAALIRAALDRHAQDCDACSGENDGCEFGGALETLMLVADADAYSIIPEARTSALAKASLEIMANERVDPHG